MKIHIGIDPGTKTGVAVWRPDLQQFAHIETMQIFEALQLLKIYAESPRVTKIKVYAEDPNTWVGFNTTHRSQSAARAQGAGSIKRDFAIWKETCRSINAMDHTAEVEFIPTQLQGTLKKLSKETFRQITGWGMQTSEHARDAAMLVFGRKTTQP